MLTLAMLHALAQWIETHLVLTLVVFLLLTVLALALYAIFGQTPLAIYIVAMEVVVAAEIAGGNRRVLF